MRRSRHFFGSRGPLLCHRWLQRISLPPPHLQAAAPPSQEPVRDPRSPATCPERRGKIQKEGRLYYGATSWRCPLTRVAACALFQERDDAPCSDFVIAGEGGRVRVGRAGGPAPSADDRSLPPDRASFLSVA